MMYLARFYKAYKMAFRWGENLPAGLKRAGCAPWKILKRYLLITTSIAQRLPFSNVGNNKANNRSNISVDVKQE